MNSTSIRILIDAKGSIVGLDPINKGLQGVSDQAKKTQESVNKAVKFDVTASVPGLKTLKTAVDGIGGAFTAVRTVAAGGLIGAAVVRGISAAVDESVKLQNALIGVDSVAKSFGQDSQAVKKAVIEFTKDGLVSATDAAMAFKQILSTGTQLPDAIKLMNSLKDVAAFNRQNFYSLGEAIVATTEGIKNGNSVRADAVGVTKNLSVLEKEYAASIGTTVGKLTDQQKIQARVAGFIRESGFAAGDSSKLLDTYSGSVAGLSTAFDRALAKIGDFITQSSLVKGSVKLVTDVLNAVAEPPDDAEKRIERIKSQLNGYLKDAENSPYKKRLEEELALLEKQTAEQRKITEETTKKKQAEISAKQASEAAAKTASDAAKERQKQIKALDKALKDAGETELQTLQKIREERLKLVGPNDVQRRLKIEQDFADKVNKLNDKNHKEQVRRANELAALNKRLTEEAIIGGANRPFSKSVMPEGLTEDQQAKYTRNTDLGRGVGALNSIVGGKEGAQALVSAAGSAALDVIAPGLGQAAKPLLDAFTQGPEAVKAQVNAFADALPDVIQGFIEAIPVFIETLVDRAPDIIERLVEKAPDIISKLVMDAPRIITKVLTLMPKIALQFINEIIRNVPRIVSEAAVALYNAIVDIFNGLNPVGSGGVLSDIGNFIGGGIEEAGNFLGLARGGQIPFNAGTAFKDSVPALLMPGERILDIDTNRRFKQMFDVGGNNQTIEALLLRVIDLLEKPMTVTSETKLNNGVLAQAILTLNRTGQRIS